MPHPRVRLSLVMALALAAACTSTEDERSGRDGTEQVRVDWRPVTLPTPPGPSGRLAVRDGARCAGTWYVVGGVYADEEESRPAVWTSTDGTSWRTATLAPEDFWAKQSILTSVACRGGQVALMGGKPGGAHGIPRVSTWYRRGDGTFVDVETGYTMYGGPEATNVGFIEAGPTGWLIAGNRTSGAAVWISPTAAEFTRVEDDPALASDSRYSTLAAGQVHDRKEWVVVGSAAMPERIPRVPMAWSSPDGRVWSRELVPRTSSYNDLQRVVPTRDGVTAVGLRGDSFGVWRRDGSGAWRRGESFGRHAAESVGVPSVSGLVRVGPGESDDLLAAVSTGSSYELWSGRDEQWRPVHIPAAPGVGGDQTLQVGVDGSALLLLADDGRAGRVWTAAWPDSR